MNLHGGSTCGHLMHNLSLKARLLITGAPHDKAALHP